MKVPPPPSYDEVIATEPIDNSNIYPSISEFNDQQSSLQPLIAIPPQYNELSSQNVNVPNQPNPNVNQVLGPDPQQAYCPICRQQNRTKVKHVSGVDTKNLVWLFVLAGYVFGCCLIPFCFNCFKDCQHFCTQCHNYIGKYQRSSSRIYIRNIIILFFCLLFSYFVLIFLSLFIYIGPPTVEECKKVWHTYQKYNKTECICYQDLKICQYSLQIRLTCDANTIDKYFSRARSCGKCPVGGLPMRLLFSAPKKYSRLTLLILPQEN